MNPFAFAANLRPSSGIWLMMSGEEKIGSK